VPRLLELGKEHIYVWEPQEGMVHEDDAATRIAAGAAGAGVLLSPPSEGKVELTAEYPGVLKVNVDALRRINSIEQVTLVTRRHNDPLLHAGDQVAGARVIPLVIEEAKVLQAEGVVRDAGPILRVAPFVLRKVGVVV